MNRTRSGWDGQVTEAQHHGLGRRSEAARPELAFTRVDLMSSTPALLKLSIGFVTIGVAASIAMVGADTMRSPG